MVQQKRNGNYTVEYLKLFPLKTKKQKAFIKWCDIRNRLLAKEHLKPGGLEIIRKLANLINKGE